MMYNWFNQASSSATLSSDYYPMGWMVNHMNWAVGPTFFGLATFGWIMMILADVVLLLLAVYLWKLIQKR